MTQQLDNTSTRFMTVGEVAAILRVSTMTVYRLINGGQLPRAHRRPARDELDRYLDERRRVDTPFCRGAQAGAVFFLSVRTDRRVRGRRPRRAGAPGPRGPGDRPSPTESRRSPSGPGPGSCCGPFHTSAGGWSWPWSTPAWEGRRGVVVEVAGDRPEMVRGPGQRAALAGGRGAGRCGSPSWLTRPTLGRPPSTAGTSSPRPSPPSAGGNRPANWGPLSIQRRWSGWTSTKHRSKRAPTAAGGSAPEVTWVDRFGNAQLSASGALVFPLRYTEVTVVLGAGVARARRLAAGGRHLSTSWPGARGAGG